MLSFPSGSVTTTGSADYRLGMEDRHLWDVDDRVGDQGSERAGDW